MAFSKPNVNTIWAETGEVIEPAVAKVAQGWIEEIPDFEFENWLQNRQDQFNAHVNQFGIPVWDSTTEYIENKSYVQGSDGEIYRAKTTHINSNPTNSSTNWTKAFDNFDESYSKVEADGRFAAKTANLSDLTNAATARSNLSVYSKTESDVKYPAKASNLSDLSDISAARTNLSIYSKGESDAAYLRKSNNLSDLGNLTTARTNLNVYSKTDIYTKTESDARYVKKSGDTMTGKLTLDGNPVNAMHAAPKQYVDQAVNPVGSVILMAGNFVPTGYLKCNGAVVSSVTYSNLYAIIGDTYGSGDSDPGFFKLPDLRGVFARGWDDNRGVDSGRDIGSYQGDEFEAHTHTTSAYSGGSYSIGNGSGGPQYVGIKPLVSTSSGGSETRPKNVAMLYCIKF